MVFPDKILCFINAEFILTSLSEELCPALGKFLAKQGSPCIPHDDCKGLSCDIEIRRKHVTGKVSVDVKVDPDNQTVTITVDGQKHTVTGDGEPLKKKKKQETRLTASVLKQDPNT